MKKFTAILSLVLVLCMLTGCAGTTVVYHAECTCPTEGGTQTEPQATQPVTPPQTAEGEVKTGLAVLTSAEAGEKDGNHTVAYDVTVAAVTVDANGVITACYIDSLGATLAYNNEGVIVTDLTAPVLTKNELGDSYGMKAYAGAKYEWYEQAAALADYAVGKTVEELRTGAVNESGKAADADLATMATIRLDGYVEAIEKAVANAQNLGAQAGDELKVAVNASLADSYNSEPEKAGNIQLNVDVAAVSVKGDVITSCVLDSVQAKIAMGADEVPAEFPTKNELGEGYGMKAWGGATYEWNEQAANFAAYVTGKTLAEVQGIAIDETTKPAEGTDLATSVTISIGGFQALLEKALQTEGAALKTGLAIVASAEAGEKDGNYTVGYDVTVVGVLVDGNGVIADCYIDSLNPTLTYDANGVILTLIDEPVQTKNDLGDAYGMKAYAGSQYEWYEQAAALADYAVGKTVEELRSGAVNESGKAADADLATMATIRLDGYVEAIEKAVANAQDLGAQAGDELRVGISASLADSANQTAEKLGNAQLNVDVAVLTVRDMVITSCYLDSLQAKVAFELNGTMEIPAEFPTKNELGDAYGMKAWGGATYEWYEQAANFAAYVTGKTFAEVMGIAVGESSEPVEADLASSVTISIGGFQSLIAEAMGG